MYMKNNGEFQYMMQGGFGIFDRYELWSILVNQNELKINTLKVQKGIDGKYICAVDELTVENYLKERNQI